MDIDGLSDRLAVFLTSQGAETQVRVHDVNVLTGGYSLFTAEFTAEMDGGPRHLVVAPTHPTTRP